MAVAMSGGVDSSVAAARVCARGVRAFGITLAMWARDIETVRDRGCCSIDAVEDARRVASALGMPHYVWNLEREFEQQVVTHWVAEHAAARTANPCTRCNERVKFGLLLERARAAGATHIATGHYARIGRRGALRTLHRAPEARRDQSYVLHRLRQEQLTHAVFPLGDALAKTHVRDEAQALGLGVAGKAESQDLCFVRTSVRDELRVRLGEVMAPGAVVDVDGHTLGEHEGLQRYTVGQRSGLALAPARPDQAPLYVLELRPDSNTIVVGERAALRRSSLQAAGCRWVSGTPPQAGTRCTAQLRAHGTAHAATVESTDGDRLRLRFDDPVEQVSPGQAAVLYDADEVLGGGVIQPAA